MSDKVYSLSVMRYRGPSLPELDEAGRRLNFRACDLSARFWLNDMVLVQFTAKEFDGCGMLMHAEAYLADRLAYELWPWPKGMMKVETEEIA